MVTKNYDAFKMAIDAATYSAIVEHFNDVYECSSFTEREYKVAYLAYLWKNGNVVFDSNLGYDIVNAEHLGIDIFRDYELSIEVEQQDTGGVNLGLTHSFYSLNELMKIV
jgi:hypothetical protein